jgi:hypothetical protein
MSVSYIILPSETAPKSPKKHYYRSHVSFFSRYAELFGVKVKYSDNIDSVNFCDSAHCHILVDYKPFILNWSNHHANVSHCEFVGKVPELKYHFSEESRSNAISIGREKCVYPSGPVLNVGGRDAYVRYFSMVEKGRNYFCNSDIVLHKQIIHGSKAVEGHEPAARRRKRVRDLLVKAYGKNVDGTVKNDKFWFYEHFKNCLVSVCVPGCSNDMLDRGHWEQAGLGVCVVAPRINTRVCWDEPLVGGFHYVECSLDYSDLIEKVEWCKGNRDKCREIGENARALFQKTYLPHNYWKWVETILNNHY